MKVANIIFKHKVKNLTEMSDSTDSSSDPGPVTVAKKRKTSKVKSENPSNVAKSDNLNKKIQELEAKVTKLIILNNNLSIENDKLKKNQSALSIDNDKAKVKLASKSTTKQKESKEKLQQQNRFSALDIEEDMETISDSINNGEVLPQSPKKTVKQVSINFDILKKIKEDNIKKRQALKFKPSANNLSINDNTSDNKTNSTTKEKMPPFVVFNQNAKDTVLLIKTKLNINNFSIKNSGINKIMVNTTNLDDYKKVKNILTEANSEFYTYTPKSLKMKSLVLKGLNNDELTDDIKRYIEEADSSIEIDGVSQLQTAKSRLTGKKLPIFVIRLKTYQNVKTVKNIKYINHQKVSWEDLINSDKIIQCKMCQRFGHTASNCHLGYRCVKCSEDHSPGNCRIIKGKEGHEAFCVLCEKSGHPASYRGCPKYKELMTKLKTKISAKRPANQMSGPRPEYSNFIKKNTSFAETLKNNLNNKPSVTPENPIPSNEINNNSTLQILLVEFRSLKQKIEENSQKTNFLMDFISSLNHDD